MTSPVVDTTARGFIRSSQDAKALKKAVAAALTKVKLKLDEFSLSKLKPAVEVYEISVKGLG